MIAGDVVREPRQSGVLSAGRMLQILYVEDDELCASMLERELSSFAHTVTVTCVPEALSTLRTQVFDVIFLDLGLPGISGLKAVEAVHAATKTPIIVMTGHQEFGEELIAFKKEAASAGADGYIVKGASAFDIRCDLHFILSAHHRREAERLLRGERSRRD